MKVEEELIPVLVRAAQTQTDIVGLGWWCCMLELWQERVFHNGLSQAKETRMVRELEISLLMMLQL